MTKSRNYLLLGGMIALLLFFGLTVSQSARAQEGVSLSFNPAEVTATTCGNVEISLEVVGVPESNPLTAYHLEVTYDPNVLEVDSVVNGGFLTDTDVLPAFYEPTNTVDDGTGRILFGMAQRGVNGNPVPKSGSGSLIKITLKAKVADGSTTFVIDAGNSMLVDWPDAFEIDFTVTVTSVVTTVSCGPTDIALDSTAVDENMPVGTVVGNLTATDPDPLDTSFSYTLVNPAGYPDNASFQIVGSELRTTEIFDYEAKSSYQILIRVTGPHGLTYDELFTITVTVEAAPEPLPIGIYLPLIFK